MMQSGAARSLLWARVHSAQARFAQARAARPGGAHAWSRVTRRVASVLAVASMTASSGCYTFGGGGGFPPKLKTMAIVPFDNQTDAPEIQRELMEALRKAFRDRLNLRDATEDKADVVITGIVGKYEPGISTGVSADIRGSQMSRRSLQLVIDIEIMNQQTGKALLTSKGMTSEGQYAEGQEADGRKLAIETMIDKIIQQTQSQW